MTRPSNATMQVLTRLVTVSMFLTDAPTPPAAHLGPWLARLLASPQGADELGRLGGYRILAVLGQGGMGAVFAAEDPTLGRRVALKVMRPEVAAFPDSRTRFLREARAA